MSRCLSVLAPTRYPWRFNGPRMSRHHVDIRLFAPFNKLSNKVEGVTVFNPFPLRRFDLVHAFNRIPIGKLPFIIGFESHLPRAFGYQHSPLYQWMISQLRSPRCRTIVAISDWARHQFLAQHRGQPWHEELAAKLLVRYPNLPVPVAATEVSLVRGEPLRLVFVGNHFGRKGGAVAVRLAERAQQQGFPIHIDVVSTLEMGDKAWLSPTRAEYWDRDVRLLQNLPALKLHRGLPNAEVMTLVRAAHFLLLPTFSDTFGYSAIEAMAYGTPVVATRQAALPEFIEDGVSGFLLPFDTDERGEWRQSGRIDRAESAYEAMFDETVEGLVHEAYKKLVELYEKPEAYSAMRIKAHETARRLFAAEDATQFWDDLYDRVTG